MHFFQLLLKSKDSCNLACSLQPKFPSWASLCLFAVYLKVVVLAFKVQAEKEGKCVFWSVWGFKEEEKELKLTNFWAKGLL